MSLVSQLTKIKYLSLLLTFRCVIEVDIFIILNKIGNYNSEYKFMHVQKQH